jgi:hypothetical protein
MQKRKGEQAAVHGHLKKVSLELGGKNSLIILDEADLDLAVANTAWGVYPDMNCSSLGWFRTPVGCRTVAIGLVNTLNRLAIGFRYTHPVGMPEAA